jgi:hypothetical protein
MTPREIDEYVHSRLAADGNLYTLHEQALAELQPHIRRYGIQDQVGW